jgi:hypothetical protein
VIGAIGEKVNMDIIFDSHREPYLFMEDRFHKLRSIAKLPAKSARHIIEVIETVQAFYVQYNHKISGMSSDNEAVFTSIVPALGNMGITLTLMPSGQHNQIIERSNRTLQEKVEVLKGGVPYELPKNLEKDCYYYSVYLLNRSWNSSHESSTPWEIHTGMKLDIKGTPLLKFGTVAVVFQPQTLRTNGHGRRGEIGVFIGKTVSNPTSLMFYIPARGRTVMRGTNFKVIDAIPEQWNWKPNPRYLDARGVKASKKDKKKTSHANHLAMADESSDSEDEEEVEDDPSLDDDFEVERDDDGIHITMDDVDNMEESDYWTNPDISTMVIANHLQSTEATTASGDDSYQLEVKALSTEVTTIDPTLSSDSTIFNGLEPGEEPPNSEELKRAAIYDELNQMNVKVYSKLYLDLNGNWSIGTPVISTH